MLTLLQEGAAAAVQRQEFIKLKAAMGLNIYGSMVCHLSVCS